MESSNIQSDLFDKLLSDNKDIKKELKLRKSLYETISVKKSIASDSASTADGWVVDKEFKTKVRFKKEKSHDVLFEDKIWSIFAQLGFSLLNKDRSLTLPYHGNSNSSTKQIDILAVDEECILVVECKSRNGEPKKRDFKTIIESICGTREGISKTLRKAFPEGKKKIKFILATENYVLSNADKERLENCNIIHFSDEQIEYYQELIKHLGLAARFQFLGNLFEGTKIPELKNKIPAIEGKMGGHTYYSFSIEPEKLLKIGYVLHRNKANRKMMPTYQRILKKSRLKSVGEFVDEGGFFPNSIILNIDSKKQLRFDRASLQVEDTVSNIGILHLPKEYKSAFIIDGQHRLYGYANSESDYKSTNSIPVVAFVNLDRQEQVKLFMDINEKQKAVPKNLRSTLQSDLLWDSESYLDKIKGLIASLAISLGEELESPLYERIQVGENQQTEYKFIKLDSIITGLKQSNFFGKFTKKEIKEDGTFYNGSNETTYNRLLKFLFLCFNFTKESLSEEWSKPKNENFVIYNTGIISWIKIYSDIVDHLVKHEKIRSKSDSIDVILEEMKFYLEPAHEYILNLDESSKADIKKSYGAGGRTKYWRLLQNAINASREDFSPDGLSEFITKEAKEFNDQAFKIIRNIETFLKNDVKNKLIAHYGENRWYKDGVPKKVYLNAASLAAEKNLELDDITQEKDAWDCLHIIDYRKIVAYGANWSKVFQSSYTRKGEESLNKDGKTAWMEKLNKIRNENFHSYSVTEEEFNFLCMLQTWLLNGQSY